MREIEFSKPDLCVNERADLDPELPEPACAADADRMKQEKQGYDSLITPSLPLSFPRSSFSKSVLICEICGKKIVLNPNNFLYWTLTKIKCLRI